MRRRLGGVEQPDIRRADNRRSSPPPPPDQRGHRVPLLSGLDIYDRENVVGPFLVHKLLGQLSGTPPPRASLE